MRSKTVAKQRAQTPGNEAVRHIASAHHLLKILREKLEEAAEGHAELDKAITNLEVALSHLTVKTGGML
jgi:hypothetical protein